MIIVIIISYFAISDFAIILSKFIILTGDVQFWILHKFCMFFLVLYFSFTIFGGEGLSIYTRINR